jgi:hypothetical protein
MNTSSGGGMGALHSFAKRFSASRINLSSMEIASFPDRLLLRQSAEAVYCMF